MSEQHDSVAERVSFFKKKVCSSRWGCISFYFPFYYLLVVNQHLPDWPGPTSKLVWQEVCCLCCPQRLVLAPLNIIATTTQLRLCWVSGPNSWNNPSVYYGLCFQHLGKLKQNVIGIESSSLMMHTVETLEFINPFLAFLLLINLIKISGILSAFQSQDQYSFSDFLILLRRRSIKTLYCVLCILKGIKLNLWGLKIHFGGFFQRAM